MSARIQPLAKTTSLFTRKVANAKRSYSFDVKRAPEGQLYFTISELTGHGSVWHRSRVLIPAEQAREFYIGLCDAIKAMREAEKAAAAERAPGKPPRAAGRASQGARPQAILAGLR